MSMARSIAWFLVIGIASAGCSGDGGDGAPPPPPASDDGAPTDDGGPSDDGAPSGDDSASTDGSQPAGPSGEGWGDLKMQFVYDGTPPERGKVRIPTEHADYAYCSKDHPLDETLVVNPKNKGLANVVVWLYLSSSEEAPAAHPDLAAAAEEMVRIDNLNCRFEPQVCLVRTTQKLVIGNKDEVGHNSKADFFAAGNTSFNFTIPAEKDADAVSIPVAERLPVQISCTIHPWMSANLVVKDHPYFAASDEDGNLVIPKLPAGNWTFQAWQVKSGYLADVTPAGSGAKWASKGRFDVTIKAGDNDIGMLKVAPSNFE